MNAETPIFRKRGIMIRKLKDRIVKYCSFAALALSVGAMLWILGTVISRGAESLSFSLLLESSKPYGMENQGIANALLGTVFITLGAVAIALPPAILAGIYLSEFAGKSKTGNILRFSANVMMGVPSVIVGLFIYAIWVIPQGQFSGFAGSLALAIIMFPVVMRSTEDILRMVPDALRESALALGMTRMRAILCIICRAAKNGLVTGILLAVARVSGETAPLLFTALWSDSWPDAYFDGPTANIPVLITEYTTNSPFEEMHSIGWAAALVITMAVLLLNIGCRLLFREKKHA